MQKPISSIPINRTFAKLRQFARKKTPEAERCELCGLNLTVEHDHLIEPGTRRLLCACQACALLFCGKVETKYRFVPRDSHILSNFEITDAEWNGLMIPINMAFFFYNSLEQRMVAMYPSPAGPVESLLSLKSWQEMARDHSSLGAMQPDVEALLVNRLGEHRGFSSNEYYLAPIDQCYKLVGLLRTHWRGFSGGSEVWDEIRHFFEGLRHSARPCPEEHHV